MKRISTVPTGAGKPSWLKLSGVAVLLVVAGWILARNFRSDLPKPNPKPFASLGSLAAEETAALIGGTGHIAIISEIPDPKSHREDPMAQSIRMVAAEVEAFRDTLQRLGKYTFLPELKLVRPSQAIKTVWPAGEFLRLLQRPPDNTTVVAFCALPGQLTATERSLLKSRSGKLVIIGGVVPEVRPLVEQRVAHLAVAAKVPVPAAQDGAPETPEAWVRRVHLVMKP